MNKPQSLYIHIPFCEHICDYCDFPKLQYFRIFAEKYIKALIKEIDSYHIESLKTIYIGGGTPTALDDDLFLELLTYLDKYLKEVVEYTVEANPESLSINKIKMMKSHGVTRISLGVESTNDKILKAINRHHTFSDVETAINNAYKYGIKHLNVDLIIGLPNVSKNLFIKDLENLLKLPIDHFSCYSLSIHPHTVFYLKGIKENSPEKERAFYDIVEEYLLKAGFIHYEISNWSKTNCESLHNLTYWQDLPYYGVGLGACGYINNIRYANTKNLNKYLNGQYIETQEEVSIQDDIEYFIMLNLRTNKGISLDLFIKRFGYDLYQQKQNIIDDLINHGLLTLNKDKECLIATYEGMMILDQIILKLI